MILRFCVLDSRFRTANADCDMELLAATSHQARNLELYQAQSHEGPCIETIEHGRSVEAAGEAELAARWPDLGRAMAAADFLTVHTSPMRWHDHAVGGVNLFWHEERRLAPHERELAQAFADICTLALMQPTTTDRESVTQRLLAALQGRVDIERAKGVLAQTQDVDIADAFTLLVNRSKDTGRPLAEIARGDRSRHPSGHRRAPLTGPHERSRESRRELARRGTGARTPPGRPGRSSPDAV